MERRSWRAGELRDAGGAALNAPWGLMHIQRAFHELISTPLTLPNLTLKLCPQMEANEGSILLPRGKQELPSTEVRLLLLTAFAIFIFINSQSMFASS